MARKSVAKGSAGTRRAGTGRRAVATAVGSAPSAVSAAVALSLAVLAAACGGKSSDFAPELGVDLSAMQEMASGLYIQTLEPGDGPLVRRGQTVVAHYTGWLSDGTKFDSSRDRGEPLRIPIGMGRVIDGWDEGIVGMRVGEVRRLVIPPELAYGEAGAGGGVIPSNATLIFEVEILGAN